MNEAMRRHLAEHLAEIRGKGLEKRERRLESPQNARVMVGGHTVLTCAPNNYLGLADHPRVIAAAHRRWTGGDTAWLRCAFICGTQQPHVELEKALSEFLGTEETILYSSCFDANGGLFETLLGEEDAVISDELNHAWIIDGIRLCKAQRHRYKNGDMGDLEAKLREAEDKGARFKLIATDGVFSMDGTIADLPGICNLAQRHEALVMVDDSHAVGFMGAGGRGTHEYHRVMDRIDILTGTLGKALGGASGGYASGRREIIDLLRGARARIYLAIPSRPRLPPHRLRLCTGQHIRCARRQLHENALSPPRHEHRRLRYRARRTPDRSGHVWRCRCRRAHGRGDAGARRLRGGVQLSGGADGQSADPRANVRRPFPRRSGSSDCRIHCIARLKTVDPEP